MFACRKTISTLWILAPFLVYAQDGSFEYKSYFDEDSMQVKEEIQLRKRDSLPHGQYLSYFQSGNPKVTGTYKNGQPSGSWIYFFENGGKKSEGMLIQGIADGNWTYYFESGQIRAKGLLEKGQKAGYWTNYYENGTEKNSGSYYLGKKEGIWNYFFEDGSLKAQAYFEEGNGNYKEFYPSGSVKMEGSNVDGKSAGEWHYFYESGELLAIGEYLKGLRNGLWTYYHKNGETSGSGVYVAGKKQGQWTYYHQNGEKSAEGKLVEDEKDGQWNLYYETGEVKARGSYQEGDGIYTEYYPNGRQKAKGEILNSKRQGRWVYFNEDGVLDGEALYEQDNGEYTGYYGDQSIKMKGPMLGEKRIGEWQLFDTEGNVAGVYRPIYEEERPVFRLSSLDQRTRNLSEKPEYVYKSNKSRYFTSVVNEYRGLIISTNPAMLLLDELPLTVEYYLQERMGYELLAIYHREPFFKTTNELSLNEPYTRGVSIRFRQKYYHAEGTVGMFYFGHQVGVTLNTHRVKAQDQTVLPFVRETLEVNEILAYYGVYVGLRWMKNSQNPGLTIDSFVGADIGYRNWEQRYNVSNEAFNELYRPFAQSRLYVPIRFGIHIGFTKRIKSKSK